MTAVEETAEHAWAGPDRHAAVADVLVRALRDIMPVSRPAAATLAARVLDVLDPTHPTFATSLLTVADAHLAGARLTATAALLRRILRRPLPAELAATLRYRLVHVLIAAGHAADALAIAEQTPVRADPTGNDQARAALVFARSLADRRHAAAYAARCLGEASSGGAVAAVAGSVLSDIAWRAGDPARARRLAERAVADADEAGPAEWRLLVRLGYARKLLSAGRHAEAASRLEEGAAELARPGTASAYAPAHSIVEAELAMRTGRPARAGELARAALDSARELEAGLLVPLAHAVLSEVSMRTGDLDRGRAHAEQSRQHPRDGPGLWSAHHEWIRLRLVAWRHGPRSAARLLTSRYADLLTGGQLLLDEPGAGVWLARLGRTVGDGGLVGRAVAGLEELAGRDPRAVGLDVAARHANGLRTDDVDALRWAVDRYADPVERAHTREDLGIRLAGRPHRDLGEATRHLQAALRTFEDLGLARDGERVRGRLRDLGVDPVDRGPRSLWSDFSETECRIAVLVSQGYTNHQIAGRVSRSVHTVNYHLRKMFRKAGVNSRSALTRRLNEAGPCPPLIVRDAAS